MVTGSEVGLDSFKEGVGEVAGAREVFSRGKVNNFDVWGDGGGLGFFGEGDERTLRLGKVEVGDERSGAPEEAGDF